MKNIRIRRFTLLLFLFAFLFISCQKENVPSVETGSVMHKTDTTITVVGNVLGDGYARAYAVSIKGLFYCASQVFKTGDFAGLRFVQLQGGTFQMGSLNGNDNEKPIYNVTLPSFKFAATEVSQALWKAITGYSYSSVRGDSMPVKNISYYDVLSFIST